MSHPKLGGEWLEGNENPPEVISRNVSRFSIESEKPCSQCQGFHNMPFVKSNIAPVHDFCSCKVYGAPVDLRLISNTIAKEEEIEDDYFYGKVKGGNDRTVPLPDGGSADVSCPFMMPYPCEVYFRYRFKLTFWKRIYEFTDELGFNTQVEEEAIHQHITFIGYFVE